MERKKKVRSQGDVRKGTNALAAMRTAVPTARPRAGNRTCSEPLVAQNLASKVQATRLQPKISGSTIQRANIDGETSQANGEARSQNSPKHIPELNFAVLGAEGVGKSTFIRCALELKRPVTSPASSKKMSLEGEIFLICLLELQLLEIEITSDQLNWPDFVGLKKTPPIHGVLALYDVTNRASIMHISSLLNVCTKINLPYVLVCCKCDISPDAREIDPFLAEQSCLNVNGIECFQTSIDDPETYKRCISVILRNLMSERQSDLPRSHGPVRIRAMTISQHSNSSNSNHPYNTKTKHGRAASEINTFMTHSASFTLSPRPTGPSEQMASPSRESSSKRRSTGLDPLSLVSPDPVLPTPTIPTAENHWYSQSGKLYAIHPERQTHEEGMERGPKLLPILSPATSVAKPVGKTHDSPGESPKVEETSNRTSEDPKLIDRDVGTLGSTFEDLVERLISQPMSKADAKFAAIFLCLYRKFAAPAELLSAVIRRFENLEGNAEPQLFRIGSQLRYLGILAQWVGEYPGDFAHPLTHLQTTMFIGRIAKENLFAVAAQEMSAHLNIISEDDDTDWACSDMSRGRASTLESFTGAPSMKSVITALPEIFGALSLEESKHGTRRDEEIKDTTLRHSKAPSSTSSTARSGSQSATSFSTLLNAVEAAQREAELLSPITRNPLTKVQWHQYMDSTDEEIARELTRIDWIMYSSIRPRDLIRHVSLSVEQKEKCRSLEHVNRMINHFNHVAFWVANMILLRDKAKHRALALEKFMNVAWKLRQLNNYNSLGAVIAGINGTAVHRLTQTRELVSQQAQKDFMRLEILMGTQKSHFAYRLAWENTTSERIPFLPLHRRDLVSAEEGNRTFIGENFDQINWRKFEIMGEVIIGVQKSQGTPYPNINRNVDVQRLVLDVKFSKDDDELYERSIQLEGPSVGETNRRRFNWFQR